MKQSTKGDRKSPLYTSPRRELEKREALIAAAQASGDPMNRGRDSDGAYRIKNRKDADDNG